MLAGNMVNAALALYRSRLRDYLLLSGQLVLWSVAGSVLWAIISAILSAAVGTSGSADNRLVGLAVLLSVAAVIATFYCNARALACGGAISRLAFLELQQTPETRATAHRSARRRLRPLLLVFLRYLLRLVGVVILLYLAVSITFGIMVAIGFSLSDYFLALPPSIRDVLTVVLTLLIGFGVMFSFSLGLLWFIAKWFVYECLLVIAQTPQAKKVLHQSWQLTKGHALRLVRTITIASLVTSPFVSLIYFLAILIAWFSSNIPAIQNFSFIIGYGLLLSAAVVVVPFWQILKSVACYDLKSCTEAIDLSLC